MPVSWGAGATRRPIYTQVDVWAISSTSEHSGAERWVLESANETPLCWGQLAACEEAVRTALRPVPRKAGRPDIRDSAGQTLASERKLRGGSLWLEAGKCFPTIV